VFNAGDVPNSNESNEKHNHKRYDSPCQVLSLPLLKNPQRHEKPENESKQSIWNEQVGRNERGNN